jgi:hypothetical protein
MAHSNLRMGHSSCSEQDRLSTRIGVSAVDILGSGELEGSGRFIMSTLAKVDQFPVDDQSLFIRQIVEIGRICGPG